MVGLVCFITALAMQPHPLRAARTSAPALLAALPLIVSFGGVGSIHFLAWTDRRLLSDVIRIALSMLPARVVANERLGRMAVKAGELAAALGMPVLAGFC